MIDVVLFQPEIPPNTGNAIRLCANSGARLHLVKPLGFELDDTRLRRAGLDYHEYAEVRVHDSLEAVQLALADRRWFAFSTRGTQRYDQVAYATVDVLMFGPETRGLPTEVLESIPVSRRLFLPQRPQSRSLNLSNAVAVAVFEAWRQLDYTGAR